VAADFAAWCTAIVFAVFERFDFHRSLVNLRDLVEMAPIAAAVGVGCCLLLGLYARRWAVGSHEEASVLAAAVAVVTALLFVVDSALWRHPLPRSSVLGAGFIALVLMGGVRLTARTARDRRRRPASSTSRMLVFGAGEGGLQSIRAMLRDPSCAYLPVALLDDDPAKRNLRHLGVRVRGGWDRIAETAKEYDADSLLIAIPSANRAVIGNLTELGRAAGLDVKVLPSLTDFSGPSVEVADIRDVQEEDLLGRRGIDTDVVSIAGYVTGKRILVTGAGGSIGSELCRQLTRYGPAELIMLDRDESALHAIELSITGRAMLESPDLVVRDIRDREGLIDLFVARRPDVVFHAAALKHLPLLQQHPGEAVQTNVWGTRNVLDAAAAAGVDHFVNISTDKAADPISVLGYSKRIAERMTSHMSLDHPGRWVSVRFGNVLGSRGSVLTTFRSQVAAGGPITVTHPDVTRFFMTVKEAVELVIQAGGIGRSGETLVLDMGDPVRIADVATRLATGAAGVGGRPIKITYTGLRAGEKLDELLFASGEVDERPLHRLISHVRVSPLAPTATADLPVRGPTTSVIAGLERLSHWSGSLPPTARATGGAATSDS